MFAKILIVDDEMDIREIIAGLLTDEGYQTRTASNSQEALIALKEERFDLIFLDIWLQKSQLDGLGLLDEIKNKFPNLPIIMISGHGNIETAVSAIKRGAYDFIEKPFKADRLIHTAFKALEVSHLKETLNALSKDYQEPELLGQSAEIIHLQQMISRVAPTNSRIMIMGPSGSGKELFARRIHSLSPRANKAFVVLNAAMITAERMESALFGTKLPNGERKTGALEDANGGILYLDEIADMPLDTQNKIFRVLTQQTFEPVGGYGPIKADVRIISSTSRPIELLVKEGYFCEDLYHRLAVVSINIPPLSKHREDIPLLVEYFIDQISKKEGLKKRVLDKEALDVLMIHNWPGNVRQLRNTIEQILILAAQDDQDDIIRVDMLPFEVREQVSPISADAEQIMGLSLREARELFEKQYLTLQISRFSGNVSRTAEFIGMERSALHRKLKNLGL